METLVHPYIVGRHPLILAHRGDSQHAPENTMPSFERAVACGVDALEIDLQWTKDGVIVVCHDERVDSVSNGTGFIRDMTYDELRRLDFGYHFTADGGTTFPYRGAGVSVVTLRELLIAFPSVVVNMDVKPKGHYSLPALISEIYDCGAERRVLVASFHQRVLQRMRMLNRELATSAALAEAAEFVVRTWLHVPQPRILPYIALQIPEQMYGLPLPMRDLVRRAHERGRKVHVWTVDDEPDMERLLSLGVDGIITNNPVLGTAVRDRFMAHPTA